MRTAWRPWGSLVLAGLVLVAAGPRATAQGDNNDQAPFLSFGQGIRISASMQVFAVPSPVSVAAIRIMAGTDGRTEPLLFPEWELELLAPIPLPHALLEKLRDGTPIPDRKKGLRDLREDELAYWLIQDYALIDSIRVPAELFKKAAETNGHVTFDHLFMDPKQYRGEVVPVEGRLLRIRKWRPSKKAQEAGVDWVYEGFIAGQTPHRPPYYVLFTTLPAGLQVRETMSVPVTFYGYFIKTLKYQAEKVDRVTDLLIGPTVYVNKEDAIAPAQSTPFSRDVMYATIGGLFAIGVAIVAMHWWFRRGDRAIHSQLAALKEREGLPFLDEPPGQNGSVHVDEPHKPAEDTGSAAPPNGA